MFSPFVGIRLLQYHSAFALQSKDDRSQAEHERARYIHALKAMSDFLRANNAPLHYRQRLHYLAIALNDLNEGKVDGLLEPTPTGGVNPGSVTSQWLGRANVALGMAALTAAGNTRNQAAKEAQRTTGIDVSKLLNWYDEFRKPPDKSRIKNSLARALFDDGRGMIEVVMQDIPAAPALADHFFARAAAHLRNQS
jgi:hypothetical protein